MVEDESRILAQLSCTTSTSVKCTFRTKTNPNQFMSRPNVQNGLGPTITTTTTNSFLNSSSKTRTELSRQENTSSTNKRPPFITAVTRGRFLPSKFDLLVERDLFTFSSRPRPVGLVAKHQCSLFTPRREQSSPPRGMHDYYNIMFDPHVVRGTTATTSRNFTHNEFGPKAQESGTSGAGGEIPVRKKRSSNLFKTRISQNTSSRLTPSGIDGRVHSVVQTECYLEEIIGDTEESDASVQTDFESFIPSSGFGMPWTKCPKKNTKRVDAATGASKTEFFDFDKEIQPFLDSFVTKVLEQAMYETIEEEEIAALREKKNYFQELRVQEEKELAKLLEQKEKMSEEKEKLQRHLEVEKVDLERLLEGKRDGGGMTGGTTTTGYTTSYLLEILPSVLNSLRQEGFLSDNVDDDVPESFFPFAPWETSTVEVEVHEHENGSRTNPGSRRESEVNVIDTNDQELAIPAAMSNSIQNSLNDPDESEKSENDAATEELPKDEQYFSYNTIEK